jgi:DNA-binding Lrp family transcriptional regulator
MGAQLDKPDIGLSQIDRKILKILRAPNGQRTTKSISTKSGIPVTTVRRRRKRLERKQIHFLVSIIFFYFLMTQDI